MWGRTGDANGDAQPGAHDLSRLAYLDCLWGPARVGRPYAHEQVDMIGLDSQFQNVSPFIGALLTNKLRTIFSNRAGQDWLAALGYPDKVINDEVDAVFVAFVFQRALFRGVIVHVVGIKLHNTSATPGAPFGGLMPREKPAYPLALKRGGLQRAFNLSLLKLGAFFLIEDGAEVHDAVGIESFLEFLEHVVC